MKIIFSFFYFSCSFSSLVRVKQMMEDGWVPPYLPQEVVSLTISSLTQQRDVEMCRCVCKMWRHAAKGIN